jgi:hypothetical protein
MAFLRTGYKGIPQGSILSPFMYNFYTRPVELDDSVVCISEKHVEADRDCLQTSLITLMTWFGDLGLSLSANKSEIMVFSKKHENPQVLVLLGQTALQNVTEFK